MVNRWQDLFFQEGFSVVGEAHLVTRAQSFKCRKQSIRSSCWVRGVRLLTWDLPLSLLFGRWRLTEVTQAGETQPSVGEELSTSSLPSPHSSAFLLHLLESPSHIRERMECVCVPVCMYVRNTTTLSSCGSSHQGGL